MAAGRRTGSSQVSVCQEGPKTIRSLGGANGSNRLRRTRATGQTKDWFWQPFGRCTVGEGHPGGCVCHRKCASGAAEQRQGPKVMINLGRAGGAAGAVPRLCLCHVGWCEICTYQGAPWTERPTGYKSLSMPSAVLKEVVGSCAGRGDRQAADLPGCTAHQLSLLNRQAASSAQAGRRWPWR